MASYEDGEQYYCITGFFYCKPKQRRQGGITGAFVLPVEINLLDMDYFLNKDGPFDDFILRDTVSACGRPAGAVGFPTASFQGSTGSPQALIRFILLPCTLEKNKL